MRVPAGTGAGDRCRQWLVGSEIALPSIMVAAAGLLARSLERLTGSTWGTRRDIWRCWRHGAVTKGADATFAPMLEPDSPSVARCARYPGRHPLVCRHSWTGVYIAHHTWKSRPGTAWDLGRYAASTHAEAGGPESRSATSSVVAFPVGFDDERRSLVAVVSGGAWAWAPAPSAFLGMPLG